VPVFLVAVAEGRGALLIDKEFRSTEVVHKFNPGTRRMREVSWAILRSKVSVYGLANVSAKAHSCVSRNCRYNRSSSALL
jgi:hypothetical protein